MSSGSEILEKIELYTKGKMSPEERVSFEADIASDEQLQKSLELSMFADEIVVAQEALKLKEQMRKDLYKSKPNWNIYALAILISICGGVGGYYYFSSKDAGPVVLVPAIHEQSVSSEKSSESFDRPLLEPDKKNERLITRPGEQSNTSQDLPGSQTKGDIVLPTLQQSELTAKDTAHSEGKKELNTSIIVSEDPCLGFKGDAKFSVTASCKGEETGEVHVYPESVKGGRAPYTFIIEGKQSSSYFDNMSSGTYNLMIKDARDCIVENSLKVLIPEKICKISRNYVFNPEYDHVWSVPYDKDKDPVRLVLTEKSGKVYYQSQVQSYQPAEWTGESNMGLSLAIGIYFFTIEYTDGSVDEGTVSITR